MRQIILEEAPQAVESIAYGITAYTLNKKPLVISLATPGVSVFMLHPTVTKLSQKNSLNTTKAKARSSFRRPAPAHRSNKKGLCATDLSKSANELPHRQNQTQRYHRHTE